MAEWKVDRGEAVRAFRAFFSLPVCLSLRIEFWPVSRFLGPRRFPGKGRGIGAYVSRRYISLEMNFIENPFSVWEGEEEGATKSYRS